MLVAPLSQREIDEKLRHENLDEWQKLWWASQGNELAFADWSLMAAAVPFPEDETLSVMDLCCGPGDFGRFIHRRFKKARVDLVDRDPFFLSLSAALNQRAGLVGGSTTRDLWDSRWTDGLPREYHVIGVTASLHWLDVQRLGEVFRDVLKLLRAGGVFLFAEPACPEAKFAPALANWKPTEPDTYDPAA
jgi:trans-aconitate methyltransferase